MQVICGLAYSMANKLRDVHMENFAVVIDTFDKDRITTESLQLIRFTWEATKL